MTDPVSAEASVLTDAAAAAAANVSHDDDDDEIKAASKNAAILPDTLRQLLSLSDDTAESAAVLKFLTDFGCCFNSSSSSSSSSSTSPRKRFEEDIMLLEEKDFEKNESLSPATQRKFLFIAEFLRRGGSLDEDVDCSMSKLVQLVHSARRLQEQDSSTYYYSGSIQSVLQKEAKEKKQKDEEKDESSTVESSESKTEEHKVVEEVINLNVGGHKFTTTRQTLGRAPVSSYLESMFSGRHGTASHRNKDGEYIIDRNGAHFQYILDFLRMGSVVTLPNKSSQEELGIEADFYGLDALVKAIQRPKIDIDEFVPDEMRRIHAAEDKVRESYRTRAAGGLDPHQGLVSLFCRDNGVTESLPLTYDPTIDSEMFVYAMDVRDRAKTAAGTPVTVSSLGRFQSNFNRQHANILHRLGDILSEEKVIIAGGSVLRALTTGSGIRTSDWWGEKSDVDIFLYARDREDANRIARRIFFALAVDHERWAIVRSRGVINMHRWSDGNHAWSSDFVDQKVQIILRLYDSPAEVLFGFDCDTCCCAYDGSAVWVCPRFVYALRRGVNTLNPLHAWPGKASYELRLAKYAHRGFAVVVPGLDKKRVDQGILGKELKALKGLARLLKLSFVLESDPGDAWNNNMPREPREIYGLRHHMNSNFSDAAKLVRGQGGYDDLGLEVIVPSVYGGDPDERSGLLWYEYVGGSSDVFPEARETRTLAWAEIVNAGEESAVDGVPDRLVDAWDTEKRSREYLNAGTVDRYDMNNLYYDHAYYASDDDEEQRKESK